MSAYRSKFDAAVRAYPFQRWQRSGLPGYTAATCGAFAAVFDRLVNDLVLAGEDATEPRRLELIRRAVLELNALNEEDETLIETVEREELCELVNLVTVACGLDPARYGGGEGPASEWREW